MKKYIVWLGIVLIMLLMAGCMGKDGSPGKLYLKISLINCTRYWDNNSNIPYGFNENTYYYCLPGSYDFEYDTTDGSEWTGYYILTAEAGEPGSFMHNGDDGLNRYYLLTCHRLGPSLTYSLGENKSGNTIAPIHSEKDSIEIIHSDGVYRFHLKAERKPARLNTQKTKIYL